jgi:hypothetical protein
LVILVLDITLVDTDNAVILSPFITTYLPTTDIQNAYHRVSTPSTKTKDPKLIPQSVYFIPSMPNASTALAAVTERLRAAFTDEELTPIGRWGLEQKLFRDTPGLVPASANSNKKPSNPRYMQFLSLTHYPTHGFIYTSEPADQPATATANATPAPAQSPAGAPAAATPNQTQTQIQNGITNPNSTQTPDSPRMIMTTVPPSSYTSLFQHFTYACQPFWCHRLTVTVPNGIVYDVGDFRVRLGDVRQTFPTARVRGTVVEIEWRGPSVVESLPVGQGQDENHSGGVEGGDGSSLDDSDVEFSFDAIEESDVEAEYLATAQLIREFWGRLGVEAKEAILVPGLGREVLERLRRLKGGESSRKEGLSGFGMDGRIGEVIGSERFEEDLDPSAGTDVARQFMEVLRFNR